MDRSSVYVNRSQSDEAELQNINDDPEVAPHALFTIKDLTNQASTAQQEALEITILFDASVLEIFINNRVAITTRVYPATAKCFGVRAFAECLPSETDGQSRVLDCECWELQPSVFWES